LAFLIAVPAAIPALFADYNLAIYQLPGWSDKIVVTDSAGRNSDDSEVGENVSWQWAVINSGSSLIEPSYIGYSFVTQVCFDDILPCALFYEGKYTPGQYRTGNRGRNLLKPGLHTISIKVDCNNQIIETNENDNAYSKTFLVMHPNLTPYQPEGWDDKIVLSKFTEEGFVRVSDFSAQDVLYAGWQVINDAASTVWQGHSTELYVDGALCGHPWDYQEPLLPGKVDERDLVGIGVLSPGLHTLTIKTDTLNTVQESNEGDNEYTRTIYVTDGSGKPNLVPYQPPGWSDKIVVSTVTGTNTDTSNLSTSYVLYADWAVINNGTGPTASPFCVQLYLDGALLEAWNRTEPQGPDYFIYINDYDLGRLNAGTHTLLLRVDCGNSVSESNENDNEYSRTFYVAAGGGLPNLTPYPPPGWSDKIVVSNTPGTNSDSTSLAPTDTLYLDWAVISNGVEAVSSSFYTELYVDGVQWQTWQSPPSLSSGAFDLFFDVSLGMLSAGTHTLRLRTDSTGAITESNEADNEYTKTITIGTPACPPPQPPIVSAPGNVTTGENYTVTWTGTSPENVYLLQESTNIGFIGAQSWVLNGTSRSFSHSGAGTYHYRVLARIHCSGQESDSSWSGAAQTLVTIPGGDKLLLSGDRFSVEVTWRTVEGHAGKGTSVRVSSDSGYFWFFSAANVELFVKLLDGRGANGHFWFFYGALTTLEYTIRVVDTQTGVVKTYFNPQGVQAGGHDTTAFAGAPGLSMARLGEGPAWGGSTPDRSLYTQGSRFRIEVTWRTPGGATGSGTAVPLTTDSGYFWFFDSSNVELVVKIVDGRGANSHFWFFYGSLTDIQFTITVTDTTTGASRSYQGQQGVQQSGYDLSAF